MDDIRRPQRYERRNYALPQNQPGSSSTSPRHQPHHIPISTPDEPVSHTPVQSARPEHPHHHAQHHQQQPQHQTHHHPIHHQYPQHQAHQQHSVAASPAAAPSYEPTQHEAYQRPALPEHQPAAKPKRFRFRLRPIPVVIVLTAAGVLFAAGYILKPSEPDNTLPSSIVKEVDYSLYFPSPMPAGYTYMKDTATFQIGQVFYKFANGKNRVTVKEEPMPQKKPDLSLLNGYETFDASIGKAAVGLTFGQPTAVVLTNSTVITMNSVGTVTKEDLKAAISNLKYIGESNQK